MQSIIHSLYIASFWYIGMFFIFGIVAKLWGDKSQPLVREGLVTDSWYYFVMPFFYGWISALFLALALNVFMGDAQIIKAFLEGGRPPLSTLPLWVQMALILVLSDVIQYWLHRGFHTGRWWKWHAIHHSSRTIDWLSSWRFHPLNSILSFTLVGVLMVMIGFSPAAFALLAPFNMMYSGLVHANLNWTFGPFKKVLASPVFHRWHHTMLEEGRDKNFAPTFPILDVLFGTFYMPEGEQPRHFGVSEPVPPGFFSQMLWPFRQNR